MILHIRNILSLNERFAYSLIGFLRNLILPLSNIFLYKQEIIVNKRLKQNVSIVKKRLIKILPEVTGRDLSNVLNEEGSIDLISEANKIVLHQFEILSVSIKFQNKIDWHLDFNSNFRWPKGRLYSKYNQVDLENNADVKYPRELSRCHHFLNLGEAYLLTNDDKYTKEFIEQVRDWIIENPYKRSINWGCSMDIAIRASNWIYALRMFLSSPLINDIFLNDIFTSLYLHGRFIYENPEKNRSYNHNHYLSDLAGQILISFLFEDLEIEETSKWKENGIDELYKEIRIQILPTGFSYERTTNYQRLVVELIAYTIILLNNNDVKVPQDIFFRIHRMFEAVLYYTYENGLAPIIGDQDNGRFLPFFAYNINYQKYLMNVGAVLFKDGVFKYFSGKNNIDVLFLTGKNGFNNVFKIKPVSKKLQSRSFSDAGFYILRSSKVYLFINNSGLSHYSDVSGGTHTHSDLLSFVYTYNEVPFLIDPGTFVYSSDPKMRMKFRSTAMHNTINIDDLDQNELSEKNLWGMLSDAMPEEVCWLTTSNLDIYEGKHLGYERLKDPVKHSRKFELNKVNHKLSITDSLKGKGKHTIKCHFHFDENVKIKIKNKVVYCKNKSENIKISFAIDTEYKLEAKEDFISKSYNQKILAPYVVISFTMKKSINLITIIERTKGLIVKV